MITITEQISLSEFKPWSGAVETLDRVIREGKEDLLESIISDMYPEGLTSTQLNDILWFEQDAVFEWCGITDEEDEEEE